MGIFRTDGTSNSIDSDKALNKFLRQYNSIYHRFNFAGKEIIYHFFKTWDNNNHLACKRVNIFRRLKAKRMFNF